MSVDEVERLKLYLSQLSGTTVTGSSLSVRAFSWAGCAALPEGRKGSATSTDENGRTKLYLSQSPILRLFALIPLLEHDKQ